MLFSSAIVSLALAAGASAKTIFATPHDKFSSSIGVLGCKIDTNRVAYWPNSPTPENFCVKVKKGDRELLMLHIDQSQGAYDISYDAWVYLQSGDSATDNPMDGGGVEMEYETVDPSECFADEELVKGGKLAFSASNSMNFLATWPDWSQISLYNICDSICSMGHDELCELKPGNNQPDCPHTLGLTVKLDSAPVYDIQYSTGLKVLAGSPDSAPVYAPDSGDSKDSESAPSSSPVVSSPAPQPTVEVDDGGKFKEVTSSAAPAPETVEAAVTTSEAEAVETTASPTLDAPSSPVAPTVVAPVVSSPVVSSPVVSSPVVSSPVVSSPGASSPVVTPSASESEILVAPSSTLSVVTLSTNQTTAAPTTSATNIPSSAAVSGSQVSFVALVSSLVITSFMMSSF